MRQHASASWVQAVKRKGVDLLHANQRGKVFERIAAAACLEHLLEGYHTQQLVMHPTASKDIGELLTSIQRTGVEVAGLSATIASVQEFFPYSVVLRQAKGEVGAVLPRIKTQLQKGMTLKEGYATLSFLQGSARERKTTGPVALLVLQHLLQQGADDVLRKDIVCMYQCIAVLSLCQQGCSPEEEMVLRKVVARLLMFSSFSAEERSRLVSGLALQCEVRCPSWELVFRLIKPNPKVSLSMEEIRVHLNALASFAGAASKYRFGQKLSEKQIMYKLRQSYTPLAQKVSEVVHNAERKTVVSSVDLQSFAKVDAALNGTVLMGVVARNMQFLWSKLDGRQLSDITSAASEIGANTVLDIIAERVDLYSSPLGGRAIKPRLALAMLHAISMGTYSKESPVFCNRLAVRLCEIIAERREPHGASEMTLLYLALGRLALRHAPLLQAAVLRDGVPLIHDDTLPAAVWSFVKITLSGSTVFSPELQTRVLNVIADQQKANVIWKKDARSSAETISGMIWSIAKASIVDRGLFERTLEGVTTTPSGLLGHGGLGFAQIFSVVVECMRVGVFNKNLVHIVENQANEYKKAKANLIHIPEKELALLQQAAKIYQSCLEAGELTNEANEFVKEHHPSHPAPIHIGKQSVFGGARVLRA